jgi:small-conductance mechanosensitive channel
MLRKITHLHKAIDRKFHKAGIGIAFPQHHMHFCSGDGNAWADFCSSCLDCCLGAVIAPGFQSLPP